MPLPLVDRGFVAAVNHVLARTGWASDRLRAHAGRQFRIDARPALLEARITDAGLLEAPEPDSDPDSDPDVTLTVPLAQAPLVLRGGMASLMSHVRIAGDAEFAEALGFVFRNLEWDAEEDLARVVGDAPAHRIVGTLRALHAAHLRMLEGLSGNVAEYLAHEADTLVPRAEQEAFAREVAALRDAVARTEKRVARLRPAGRRR